MAPFSFVKLERAVKLGKKDQNLLIENIVQSRQNEVSFNTSWLENLYEEIILETQGDRITPLVSNPGRIMLTSSRIYFQPFNNVEVDPVVKMELSSLTHAMKRQYMLRHVVSHTVHVDCNNWLYLIKPQIPF
uniref:BEACH-type PH domain-containing protein n=1 Tax=Amphimedon queenslandica TaxID=400682 RepID=A0A1X7SMG0_AMPQE